MNEDVRRIIAVSLGGGTTSRYEDAVMIVNELKNAGYVIVPREPNEDMAEVGTIFPENDDWSNGRKTGSDVWREMVNRALK